MKGWRLLCPIVLLLCPEVGARARASAYAVEPSLESTCDWDGRTLVRGYAENRGNEALLVQGTVTFIFYSPNQINRQSASASANAIVAPGQRALVAQMTLPFTPWSGARCELDLSGALRRR